MEMQQAARQVHNENAQLRSMLHEVGFSNEQIAQRLSGIARSRSDDHKRLPIPQTLLPNATPTSQYQPTNTLTPSQHHSSGTGSPTNESSLDAGGGTAFLAQRPMIHSQQSAAFPTSQWDDSLLPGPEQPIPNTTTGHLLGGQTALPEWDLYTWLTDLSNIKDAFGAGVNVSKAMNLSSPAKLTVCVRITWMTAWPCQALSHMTCWEARPHSRRKTSGWSLGGNGQAWETSGSWLRALAPLRNNRSCASCIDQLVRSYKLDRSTVAVSFVG